MRLVDDHPQLIAAAIAAAGALYLGVGVLDLPFLVVEPPGATS